MNPIETIFAKARELKDRITELGIGTGGEPLLLTKFAGRVAAVVAAWVATNIPGVAGFEDAIAAIVAAAAVETVTDFIARNQVAPKWKVVTAAVAGKVGAVDRALDAVSDKVDLAQDQLKTARDRFLNGKPTNRL